MKALNIIYALYMLGAALIALLSIGNLIYAMGQNNHENVLFFGHLLVGDALMTTTITLGYLAAKFIEQRQ